MIRYNAWEPTEVEPRSVQPYDKRAMPWNKANEEVLFAQSPFSYKDIDADYFNDSSASGRLFLCAF